jgi:hypothetical protein
MARDEGRLAVDHISKSGGIRRTPQIAVLRRPTPDEDSARTAVLTAEAFWCSLDIVNSPSTVPAASLRGSV